MQNFPNDERAVTVAYNLTVQYIKKNDWKGVARASDKFLKRSLNIPTHYRLAAQVNTGTAQFKLSTGDKGRKLFDEVVISAKQLAEKNEMATLDAIGRDAIAQALFMTGEIEFEKVKLIKGNYKKLEEATKLAAKKIEAAKIAEGFMRCPRTARIRAGLLQPRRDVDGSTRKSLFRSRPCRRHLRWPRTRRCKVNGRHNWLKRQNQKKIARLNAIAPH